MNHAPALAPVTRVSARTAAITIAPARFALFLNVFVRKPAEEPHERTVRKSVWHSRVLKAAA
jgi:hypothetical protein